MIQAIADAQFPVVVLPFYGVPVCVKLRELTQAQLYACGGAEFSLIETFQDRIRNKKPPTLQEMVDYAEVQHRIAKRALACPTYEQIMEVAGAGIDRDAKQRELDELEALIAKTGDMKLEERIAGVRVWLDLLLPSDFLAGVCSYAMGIDKSDIKDITEKTLYDAAVLAKLGHDNPSDHVHGAFTPFMRDDINRRAWAIFAEKQKEENAG